MSKVTAIYSGFVGLNGVPHPLVAGDAYDESHPLVQQHPEMFLAPTPAPSRSVSRNKLSSDG